MTRPVPGPRRPFSTVVSAWAIPMALASLVALVALVPAAVAAQQTTTLPARDRALDATARPLFTVGVMDGAEHEMFGRVPAVAFDAAGNLYVLDAGNHRVVVFGPDGRFVRTFGRRGGGPGELQGPMALSVAGDEVTVLDMANNSAIVYHRDGRHLRNLPFEAGERPGRRFGAHPRGGFVYEPMPFSLTMTETGPQMQPRESLPVLWRGTSASAAPRTLFEAPAPPPPTVHQAGTGDQRRVRIQSPTPPMFEPTFQWTVLGDGGLAVASTEHYRVEIVGPDGRPRRVLERGISPRRVVERDRERARSLRQEALASGAGMVTMGSGGGAPPAGMAGQARAAAEQALANMTFAETVPVIQAMAVDAEGRLWLRRAGARDYDRGPIDVIAPGGRYLGTLPEGTAIPHAFGPDGRAAYIETDDLGIQRVAVRRLADWRG